MNLRRLLLNKESVVVVGVVVVMVGVGVGVGAWLHSKNDQEWRKIELAESLLNELAFETFTFTNGKVTVEETDYMKIEGVALWEYHAPYQEILPGFQSIVVELERQSGEWAITHRRSEPYESPYSH